MLYRNPTWPYKDITEPRLKYHIEPPYTTRLNTPQNPIKRPIKNTLTLNPRPCNLNPKP